MDQVKFFKGTNFTNFPQILLGSLLNTLSHLSRSDVKAITKKINKTSGTSFDQDCIAVNISQLLDKKIITNVKTPQHLDSFCLSTTEISSEDNLPSQVEEIILDDTQQCQQNTHFIRILLDDIINNALGNLDKSSDETKITTHHTN